MDINRFTEKLQEAVRQAQAKAVALSHQQVDTEHLFLSLIEQADGLAPALLIKADAKPDNLHRRLVQELDRQRPVVAVCRSGTRSAQACVLLTRAGFTQVANLAGGMLRWRAQGHAVDGGLG